MSSRESLNKADTGQSSAENSTPDTARVRVHSVAVGSVPSGFAAAAAAGNVPLPSRATRLQRHAADDGASMFDELHALAAGQNVPCESSEPEAVRKVQLPGPLTLLRTGEATQQTSIREIRAALDQLLEIHPELNELWLDEPMLAAAPVDWYGLVGKCVRAIRSEYLDLNVGVHCCAAPAWRDLLAQPGVDIWSFDLTRDLDDVLDAWIDVQPQAELAWSLVPTAGPWPDATSLVDAIVAGRSRLGHLGDAVVSMACGVGTRSLDEATAAFELLEEVRAKSEAALNRV